MRAAPRAIDCGRAGGAPGQPDQRVPDHRAPDRQRLTLVVNEKPCAQQAALVPDPGEEGQRIAARLTPPTYPFAVVSVGYTLFGGPGGSLACDTGLAHKVELSVSKASAPEPTPEVREQWTEPAAPNPLSKREMAHALSAPLTLAAGEHLFVTLEVAGASGKAICAFACDGHGIEDRNYWGKATAPPFTWVTLKSLGQNLNLLFEALGQ